MKNTHFIFFFLISNILAASMAEDFYIRATTPGLPTNGRPNTFIGTTGTQIASSLLPSKTAAMLWGSVPADAVTNVCTHIVQTGRFQYTAKVDDNWGGSESLTLKVVATGGCGAAPDSSGAEFVFIDNFERRNAIVCPVNAGSSGCGVYMTGSDVDRLFQKGMELNELNLNYSRVLSLDPCREGAGKGAISGAIFGVLGLRDCAGLGPFAPLCAVGVLGLGSAIGAAAGCASASACFPRDAWVRIPTGKTKMMSQLQVGDKVGTLDKNGKLGFSEIYAFGHQDFLQEAQFISLETSNSKRLQLSPSHFIPMLLKGDKVHFKRAQDVLVGDVLLAVASPNNNSILPCIVTEISTIIKQGLFNPLTIQGTIVVNGVVASVHSDWFLDPLFDVFGLSALLPVTYQVILSPARLLYTLLGHKSYLVIYGWIHSKIDIPQFGTENGGKIVVGGLIGSLVGGGIVFIQMLKKKI